MTPGSDLKHLTHEFLLFPNPHTVFIVVLNGRDYPIFKKFRERIERQRKKVGESRQGCI